MLGTIRACGDADRGSMLAIINEAAEAYHGAIPADCWHEPYMGAAELDAEIAAGISFNGITIGGALVGIMGIQPIHNVILIRHAYVLPQMQGQGVGSALLRYLCASVDRPVLIGTWAAAVWAIRFYQNHGFTLVGAGAKDRLLDAYWTIPARQRETSVVLARPALDEAGADRLIMEKSRNWPG